MQISVETKKQIGHMLHTHPLAEGEVRPIDAVMSGYSIMRPEDLRPEGHIFITALSFEGGVVKLLKAL